MRTNEQMIPLWQRYMLSPYIKCLLIENFRRSFISGSSTISLGVKPGYKSFLIFLFIPLNQKVYLASRLLSPFTSTSIGALKSPILG